MDETRNAEGRTPRATDDLVACILELGADDGFDLPGGVELPRWKEDPQRPLMPIERPNRQRI